MKKICLAICLFVIFFCISCYVEVIGYPFDPRLYDATALAKEKAKWESTSATNYSFEYKIYAEGNDVSKALSKYCPPPSMSLHARVEVSDGFTTNTVLYINDKTPQELGRTSNTDFENIGWMFTTMGDFFAFIDTEGKKTNEQYKNGEYKSILVDYEIPLGDDNGFYTVYMQKYDKDTRREDNNAEPVSMVHVSIGHYVKMR